MASDYKYIALDVEEGVMTLTLCRPDRLNAYTPAMGDEIIDALRKSDEDDDVRAVIVTGAGRAFCAGADLQAGSGTFADVERHKPQARSEPADPGGKLSLTIFDFRKPIIAAINGAAVGIGVTMTLPMDVRLAAETAKFGFVFVRRGIVPEACSSWFLPRLVGMQQAADWVFSGRVFPADEALRGRLVHRVLPQDDLLPAARTLASDIAEHASPVSVALSRQMLWKGLVAAHPADAFRIESLGVDYMRRSADAREGVASFLEKRPAKFTLRPSRDMPDFYPWWDQPAD